MINPDIKSMNILFKFDLCFDDKVYEKIKNLRDGYNLHFSISFYHQEFRT